MVAKSTLNFGDADISPEMIDAGYKVLDESGRLNGMFAQYTDKQLVAAIYLAMSQARQGTASPAAAARRNY